MFSLDSKPTIFFDCDDTLVMWTIPQDYSGDLVTINYDSFKEVCIPNKYVIEHLKKMKRRAHNVVVWSAGGGEWAKAVVEGLGLEKYVDATMSKPDYYVDDIEDPREWMGKYGYITLSGKVIRKSHTNLENIKTNVEGDGHD